MGFVRVWATTSANASVEEVLNAFAAAGVTSNQARHLASFVASALYDIATGTYRSLSSPSWVLGKVQVSWRHVIGKYAVEKPKALAFCWNGADFDATGYDEQWEVKAETADVTICLRGTALRLCVQLEGESGPVLKIARTLRDLDKWAGKQVPYFEDDDADSEFKTFEGTLDAVALRLQGGS